MYNNYEMAKNDLDGLQLKLENLTKSKQQLEKMILDMLGMVLLIVKNLV